MFIKKLLVILLVAAPFHQAIHAKATNEDKAFAGAVVLFVGFVAYKYYQQQSKDHIALQEKLEIQDMKNVLIQLKQQCDENIEKVSNVESKKRQAYITKARELLKTLCPEEAAAA